MTFDQFKQKFSEAIEDDEVLELTPDQPFRDLENWDSLAGMSVIALIDQEFGLTIKADEMNKVTSLQELYDLILSKKV